MSAFFSIPILFAQDSGSPLTAMAAIISIALSAIALLGWLVRHLFTVTIPNLLAAFNTSMDKVLSSEENKLTKICDTFAANQDSTRKLLVDQLEAERSSNQKVTDRLVVEFKEAHKENTAAIRELQDELVHLGEGLNSVAATFSQRTRMADLVAQANDAILSMTPTGIITGCNIASERFYGWGSHELMGQSIHKLVAAEKHAEQDEMLQRVRNGDKVDNWITERLRKDGTTVRVNCCLSPILNAQRQVSGASCIAREAA